MSPDLSPVDRAKFAAARRAVDFVENGMRLGLGTGSTAAWMVRCLAERVRKEGLRVQGVPTSTRTAELAHELGLTVVSLDEAKWLDLTIDGADEIDPRGYMIKGGGAALTREKIVAAQARRFVCIADESKRVQQLGAFPLPVEVVPMATQRIVRQFAALGGQATLRHKDGKPLVTDNGQHILDVRGLLIAEPLALESEINQWPGVVAVGIFAHQKAHTCLLGTAQGVETLKFD